MSKDPAMLFYTSDFLTGTMLMTHEQVGIYIRLLCVMHQHGGSLDLEAFDAFIGSHEVIRSKFIIQDKTVFNQRLMEEMTKRSKKSSSLSANAKIRWEGHCKSNAKALKKHMPIEDENVNENEVKKQPKTTIPTLDEVKEYFKEKKTKIDPDTFWNWYEARGWAGIKKWKSCLVTWEKRQPLGKTGEHKINDDRDVWEKKANKQCSNCRGSGSIYAPGTGKYSKCGCVKQ